MYEIGSSKQYEINGGAIHWGIISIIGGAVTFVIELIDGIYNPNACK